MKTCYNCGFTSYGSPCDEEAQRIEDQIKKERGERNTWLVMGFLALVWILFPGLLLTMLLDIWVGYESVLWSWISVVSLSLLVFIFCGANWKAYLVLDGILVVIGTILCWIISGFAPYSWAFEHMFGG